MYFITGPGKEAIGVANAETTITVLDEFNDVFTGIGCFKGTFSLQDKFDAKPY